MAATDNLLILLIRYFEHLGYDVGYLQEYFSGRLFNMIVAMQLANANVVIRNKSDRNSHQTHIALVGESRHIICDEDELKDLDTKQILLMPVLVSDANLHDLYSEPYAIGNPFDLDMIPGEVTYGKRTQGQVQLSKNNKGNSPCFNTLREGLYENDLLILLRYREKRQIVAVGIKEDDYQSVLDDYSRMYDPNTFLMIPKACQVHVQ